MITISLVNKKGGVGKTTLCDEIAHHLASRGYKVEVTDLDDQQGSYFVNNITDGEEPDFNIIDTRGASDLNIDLGGVAVTVPDIIESSDLVVIPSPLKADCVEQLPKTVDICEAKGIPYVIVPNMTNFNYTNDRIMYQELNRNHPGRVSRTSVAQSTFIDQARTYKTTVLDVNKRSKGAVAISVLVDELLEMVNHG